ncbi:ATP-binding protein [Nocardia sp. NBC_00565]|uniref:ATP-binding protein n=1 Tax=Nocardia sp. NBC_00565 TaxID=2975993 RepID=UPI002E805CC3|nr:ATP-binding protein [Nocardia sp. NBC_00565]WUC02003.1 ATP-binding protein [Nocardia sp. NBC_00565]
MEDLILKAGDDLVARIAHEGDPVRAVVELVWNAIDAEATTVAVELERNTADAIAAVRVVDDGHGISSDEVESTFGRIGDSWKKRTEKTKNGQRYLHGKLGEGRLRAFALGTRVTWASVSSNTAGVRQEVTISGSHNNRHVFRWDAAASVVPRTGTTVTIHNDQQRSLAALEVDTALATLRSHFAPILLNEQTNLTVTFDKTTLDPSQEMLHDKRVPVSFGDGTTSNEATVRIIEWRSGKHRAIYFGPDEDHFPYEESGSDIEGQFAYSAYVTWPGLGTAQLALLGLGDMAPEPVGELWQAIRKAIREHFAGRRRERRREQVDQWKETGAYPYQGEPASEPERAERAVFDVVSGTLVPHISKNKNDARLTLVLLRDAIRHDPDQLTTILHEVVSLNEADRDTLTRLLSETTLSAIIRSANLVTSRHKFLAGLQHLIFDPRDAGRVGERDHLHKILERELWIFGEGYHLMNSERGLTELLRTHLLLEGLPASDVTPVTRWDGTSGRVDLHLAAQYKEHDRIRHLVIELKAPNVTLTQKELNQLEGYINTVRTTAAFATDRSSWDFILVGTDFDDLVDDRIPERYRETGQFLSPPSKPGRPHVRGFVRRWRDIIDENKRRLDFVTSTLEHDPSITEGLQYVRAEYRDLLPASLLESQPTTPAA